MPVKALAWEDESGKVWLSYNDMKWVADRHVLDDNSKSISNSIGDAMAMVCNAAAKK